MENLQTGGPLADLRILEVSSVVMAPMAGRILAKLGATVTRVEPPLGDVIRRSGATRNPGMSGAHLALGSGKDNIAIDMRSPEGQDDLKKLIAGHDVLITNYLPRRRAEFGLDWETVRTINPQMILCTSQGYASDSPYADLPAYDDTIQAASGTCDIYAKADGEPRYSPYIISDKVCGITIVYCVLAAVHNRHNTGVGEWVDVPMLDVMVDFNLTEQLNDFTFSPPLGGPGWHRTLAPSRRPHPSADGWVCILPYSDLNWADFVKMTGEVGEHDAIPYSTNRDRNTNTNAVQAIIARYAKNRSTEVIKTECNKLGVPVQEVNEIESLTENDYLRSRGTIKLVEHPSEGEIWRTTPNISFSTAPLVETRAAGSIDQDRASVLLSVVDSADHTKKC